MPAIVMVVGISGVGKTTFVHKLNEFLDFQHLTAGTLIALGRSVRESDRDLLRFENPDENQALLVEGFQLARHVESQLIILDGHVVIHSASGIHEIETSVFAALNVSGLIHLIGSPTTIYEYRKRDPSRGRPNLKLELIKDHQAASLNAAARIATSLSIPWIKVEGNDVGRAKEFIIELSRP
jgi:adenylate kinase